MKLFCAEAFRIRNRSELGTPTLMLSLPCMPDRTRQSASVTDLTLSLLKRLSLHFCRSEKEVECTMGIFIEPVEWMQDQILTLEGKLSCPKCKGKLKNFQYSCSNWKPG